MIKKGHAGEDYFPSFPKKKEKIYTPAGGIE